MKFADIFRRSAKDCRPRYDEENFLLAASPCGFNLIAEGVDKMRHSRIIAKIRQANSELDNGFPMHPNLRYHRSLISHKDGAWYVGDQPVRGRGVAFKSEAELERYVDEHPVFYRRLYEAESLRAATFDSCIHN